MDTLLLQFFFEMLIFAARFAMGSKNRLGSSAG
jgi:hypothetical protein